MADLRFHTGGRDKLCGPLFFTKVSERRDQIKEIRILQGRRRAAYDDMISVNLIACMYVVRWSEIRDYYCHRRFKIN